jgi:hypothetical protein
VIGDIAESVTGRVVLFGKRIGEINGLYLVSYVSKGKGNPHTGN